MAVRYGRYEVLYMLGQGAMAQVFLAKDPVLSRFVVVKVLRADLATRKDVLQRFFNEARTVAVIRNPHVVEVFDFGQEGKDLYLVMEFVDGLSLHGLLRRIPALRGGPHDPRTAREGEGAPLFEPMDPAVAAALMCQAAEGLSIAAGHGVVHRDLKPENLMLNTQGYLKISDFGIAHVQDDSLTKTGAVLGSPLYMSPEQARGLKPITSQSDIFSLGAVFYACLAGHPPFRERTVTELFRAIASEAHVPLSRLRPGMDPGLGNLVDTLLRKNPEERGGGPRWLHRQLKSYLMSLGVMDPAELASGYLKELESRGVQTTWKGDGRNATVPFTLPLTLAATQRDSGAGRIGTARVPAFPSGPDPMEDLPGPDTPGGGGKGRARRLAGVLVTALALLGLGAVFWTAGGKIRAGLGGPERPHGRGSGAAAASIPLPGGQGIPQVTAPAESPGLEGVAAAPGVDFPVPADAVREPRPDPVPSGAPAEPPAAEPKAALILKSSPPFAEAYVDGRFVGMTPVRLDPIEPGNHRLSMKSARLPGFDTILEVRPGIQAMKVHLEAGPSLRFAATPIEGD